jgi:hypothetical protein
MSLKGLSLLYVIPDSHIKNIVGLNLVPFN